MRLYTIYVPSRRCHLTIAIRDALLDQGADCLATY